MLIELFGRNFGCFRDEFRLSMLATDIDPDSDRGIVNVTVEGDAEPLRLLRAVALYGPNASGKSTVLRAAGTLSYLLRTTARLPSDSPLSEYEPFALGSTRNDPVRLGIKAVVGGRVYEYEFSFNRAAFLSEQLLERSADGESISLFDRRGQDVTGVWTQDPQFALVKTDFRENALLLSLADSLAPGVAKKIAVGLRRLLRHSDPRTGPAAPPQLAAMEVAAKAMEDQAFNNWLIARLKAADVGVVDVQQREFDAGRDKEMYDFYQIFDIHLREALPDAPRKRVLRRPYLLNLLHNSETGPVSLPYDRESLGTQRLVEWSPLLYDLTHSAEPQAAFVDEFDASMHPLLFQTVIASFNSELPAESRGQLIFAAHETSLLDAEARRSVLRRDQVYLTEKSADGAARLFSIAEFRERNNLNLRRRYLHGRYGALPALGELAE